MEKAHRQKIETELAEWEARRQQRSQDYQRSLSTWTRALEEQQDRLRADAASDLQRGRLVIPVCVVVVIVMALLGSGAGQLSVTIFLGLVITFVPSALRFIQVIRLKSEAPPAPLEEARPAPDSALPLSLVDRWWRRISDEGHPARKNLEHGDEGEEIFFRDLARILPDEYFGFRSVLVKQRLDVDVLIVGPTAVWLFEVKHWRGTITCRDGRWRRVKTYYAPGGVLRSEEQDIKGFDKQWMRERTEVAETLRRRLAPSLRFKILGGLVFTHHEVRFDIDSSVGCEYGNVQYWVERLRETVEGEKGVISQEWRLRIIDVLLARAASVADISARERCGVELAEEMFAEVTDSARKYVAHHAG